MSETYPGQLDNLVFNFYHSGCKVELGEYIQKRREEMGLSRKEIASLLGITEDYYKKIEIGLRTPSIRVKAKIAVILKISLNDMT